jgi:hypothetical protein
VSKDDDQSQSAGVVDFNALHAALGELPPAASPSAPNVGESHGRSNATYSSSRPHSIPATRAPNDDPNAPAVIVKTDANDTITSGAPQQMTVPMTGAPAFGARAGIPGPAARLAPPGFAAEASSVPSDKIQLTMQMPGRPRRPRTPTVVVRSRGPTRQQKLVVFMAMLLVFVSGGIAFLFYGKSLGLNIDGLSATKTAPRNPSAAATTPAPSSMPSPVTTGATTAPTTGVTTNVPSAVTTGVPASALPSASAKKLSAPRR